MEISTASLVLPGKSLSQTLSISRQPVLASATGSVPGHNHSVLTAIPDPGQLSQLLVVRFPFLDIGTNGQSLAKKLDGCLICPAVLGTLFLIGLNK